MIDSEQRYCIICGKLLVKRQKMCCSRSCSATYGNSIATGTNARAWKGGQKLRFDGYSLVYIPEHPNASYGYMYKHRLVMEEFIGRYLLSTEIVHHKNGIKSDNRIENLVLLQNQSEHLENHNYNRKAS